MGSKTDVIGKAAVPFLLILGALLLGYLDLFQSRLGVTPAQEISLTILLVTAVLWVSEAIPLFVTSFVVLILTGIYYISLIVIVGAVICRAFAATFGSLSDQSVTQANRS